MIDSEEEWLRIFIFTLLFFVLIGYMHIQYTKHKYIFYKHEYNISVEGDYLYIGPVTFWISVPPGEVLHEPVLTISAPEDTLEIYIVEASPKSPGVPDYNLVPVARRYPVPIELSENLSYGLYAYKLYWTLPAKAKGEFWTTLDICLYNETKNLGCIRISPTH